MSPISSQTTYLLKLQDRWKVAERTMAFQFEKPEGFIFKAGQFVDMTLIHPSQTDAEGNRRAFSIASAPDEGMLLVATRMRDTAFKRVLASMPIGTQVKVEEHLGRLGGENSFDVVQAANRQTIGQWVIRRNEIPEAIPVVPVPLREAESGREHHVDVACSCDV